MPLAQALVKEYRHVVPNDLLATATELTAWSIAESYRLLLPRLPDETVLSGGGTENLFLVLRIREYLEAINCRRVRNIAELGIISKAKEAMAFAVLAALTLASRPGNLPGATGADRGMVLGVVAPAVAAEREVRES